MILQQEQSNFFENMAEINIWVNENFSINYQANKEGLLTNYVLNEADGENIISKLIQIVKTWFNKVSTTLSRFTAEASIKITKAKTILNKKLQSIKSGSVFPEGSTFKSYNYKEAMNKIEKMNFIFNGQSFSSVPNDIKSMIKETKNWCGKEMENVTVKDIKDYALGSKEIIINNEYISAESCLEEIKKFDKNISDIKDEGKKAKSEADKLIKMINSVSNDKSKLSSIVHQVISLNNSLLAAKLSITVGYMNQLIKIGKIYLASSDDQDNPTPEFLKAVDEKKVLRIRIMMKDSLLVDHSFKQFDKMASAARNVNGLYDKHDGTELNYDKSSWTENYMNELMVQVVNNFSHERLNLLKQIVQYLYN